MLQEAVIRISGKYRFFNQALQRQQYPVQRQSAVVVLFLSLQVPQQAAPLIIGPAQPHFPLLPHLYLFLLLLPQMQAYIALLLHPEGQPPQLLLLQLLMLHLLLPQQATPLSALAEQLL